MNKVKQIALAISAISVMGVASIGLASSCPTTISPATATCLSNAADTSFQTNYITDYAKQSGGSGGSLSSSPENNNNSALYSSPNTQPQQQPAPNYNKTNTYNKVNDNPTANTNNSSTKKSIRWF